jgi:hypothetical protein
MDENKIVAAAAACIEDALKSDKPYRSINEALAKLKLHGWTDDERLEVQTRVLQEMKRRREANGC